MSMNSGLLSELTRHFGPDLHDGNFDFDKIALLRAIASVESSFGTNSNFRHEPSYDKGGKWYKKSKMIRDAVSRHGYYAACSCGPFQIMYTTALELGMPPDVAPAQLHSDWELNTKMAVKYLNARAIPGATCVEDLFDAYNSGSHRDHFVPDTYIAKALMAYEAYLSLSGR